MIKIYPIFIPHRGCNYNCIYCNQYLITKVKDFTLDKYESDIKFFLKKNAKHECQIAFFGGTFTNLPRKEMNKYLSFVNSFSGDFSIRISTRPDCIDDELLALLKKNNVKTIELGVQSFSDAVLQASGRIYTQENAILSCNKIKNAGLQLGIQLMPGLPKDNFNKFMDSIKTTILIAPHFVRIYPTIVIQNTGLENRYNQNKYIPLSLKEAIEWTATSRSMLEKNGINVIKTGLHSDFKKNEIIAGPYHENFGEFVNARILIDQIKKEKKDFHKIIFSNKEKSLFLGNKKKMLHELTVTLKKEDLQIYFSENCEQGRYTLI